MPMKESSLIAKIKKYLKGEGWIVWKNHGSQFSEAGIPDLMALKSGTLLALEAKVPGNKPSALQTMWVDKINAHGGIAAVVYSVEDVQSVLSRAAAGVDNP